MKKAEITSSPQIVKLGQVCSFVKGKKPKLLKKAKNDECSISYINIKAFEKGIVQEYTDGKKCCMCDEDDILMVWDGARCGLIGKAPKGAVGSTLMKIVPTEKINKEYLFHFLDSKFHILNTQPKGVGIPHIEPNLLRNFEIVLPIIDAQKIIVSKIEELLSELDNGKKLLITALEQLTIYRQSLLKWAFEGKLTNPNVKDGELPKNWKWVQNKELLMYVTSGSRDWKQYYSDKGSRFVRTQDIRSNHLNIQSTAFVKLPDEVEGKRSLIETGDLLMTITGANVGKIALIDFPSEDTYVSQSVALLKYNDKRYSKYLWYYFQATGFGKTLIEKAVYGVGRPVLSLENLKGVFVLLPPVEEQQRIIEELDRRFTVCDKIDETIKLALLQSESLRQSILQKAFEGKIV